MGNESSSNVGQKAAAAETLNSPTTSTGMPASFSFLAKKRNSTKSAIFANNIVVVNEGPGGSSGAGGSTSAADPNADLDLRRIKEIPHFLPLLRGVLPGYRDLPDIHQKVDPRTIYRFVGRLQHHFRACSETITAEEGRLYAQILQVDHLALSLWKKMVQASKRLDALGAELKRADAIAEQLDTTQVLFHELAKSAESLNRLLPPDEQLPPLAIAFTPLQNERRQRHFVAGTSAAAAALAIGQEEGAALLDTEGELIDGRVSECRVVDMD